MLFAHKFKHDDFSVMNIIRTFLQTSILASMVLTSLSIHSNPALAQQRACVITDEGATVCGKLTTQEKKPNQSSEYRYEGVNGIYLLKGCRRSNRTVRCNFIITSKGAEYSVNITPYESIVVDSLGRSYPASNFTIGNNNNKATTIFPRIDYPTILIFENIPTQVTQAKVLSIF
jgi:hypothetical protein